ncbi:hypothetical protein ACS0TY_033923 [Phlomoides rotata]
MEAPTIGCTKLNSDAATLPNGWVGLGFVIRDAAGSVLLTSTRRYKIEGNSTLLEALALRFGLEAARQYGIATYYFEMDSSNLCHALNSELKLDAYAMLIVEDIQHLVRDLHQPSFLHIPRETNFVTHAIAHLNIGVDTERIKTDELPCIPIISTDVRLLPISN